MQGSQQTAREQRMGEEAALVFKRMILEETEAFEQTPQADLFRVNLLAQMLDRFDDYASNGANTQAAIAYVKREYADLAKRMRDEGFESAQHVDARKPLLTEAEAAAYIKECDEQIHRRAIGVGLCCACLLPLMLLCGASEMLWGYTPDPAALLGLCGMFGMIASGVYALVTTKKPEAEQKIKKKRFSLSARLRKKLMDMKTMTKEKARRRRGVGIALLASCVLPIFLGAALDAAFYLSASPFAVMGVGGMFAMIGAGVYEVIVAEGEKKTIDQLLKE